MKLAKILCGLTCIGNFLFSNTLVAQTEKVVQLKDDSIILVSEENVYFGYEFQGKKDFAGSVSFVGNNDFNQGAIYSLDQLITGKVAGVSITSNNGAPGAGATIRVRGGSSLNASNDPLIVIDGVPVDMSTTIGGLSNLLAIVNPDDIESFKVIKDPSAALIYGSLASNGVIIINTKKSKEGYPMKINYNENTSLSYAPKFISVYSGDQVRQIAQNNQALYGIASLNIFGSENTDWQKQIFHTTFSQDHYLSFSGVYKILPYRISLGYTDDNGVLKNTGLQRFTGAINLNPSFFNNSLKVNVNAKGMTNNTNFGDAGSIVSAVSMDPSQLVMDGNSNSAGYFQWGNHGASLGTPNPVEQALATDNKSTARKCIANIQLDYANPIIPELHANLNLATDRTLSTGHDNLPTTAPYVLTSPLSWGKLDNYNNKNYNTLFEFYLNYTKDFSIIYSKIDAFAGYSKQHFKNQGSDYIRSIQDVLHPYQLNDSSSFSTENYLPFFFGRLNYSLLDKYLLTFTVCKEGSSRFTSAKWGVFSSVAFAWKIINEPFLKDVTAVSDLKLRLGFGRNGQQNIVANDNSTQAQYIQSAAGSYYMNGAEVFALTPNVYDPNLKWEQISTQNAGLDFGFLKNRISGSFDVYKNITSNLMQIIAIPSGSSFSNSLLTNAGSMQNQGYELSLNLVPISEKNMSLIIGFNLAYNQNKITNLPNSILIWGGSYTGNIQIDKEGAAANSFFMNKQVYNTSGSPIEDQYVDLSGKGGTISGNNADKYVDHNPFPDYTMGLSVRFNYKYFDISASGRINLGNYVYNQLAAGASYDQMYQLDYWHNEPTYLSDTKFVSRQFTSDYFVQNASFFKLDNLSIGYRFNNIYDKLGARVSFTAQNIFTITPYKGVDPEIGYNNNEYGVDNPYYPRPRIFSLGISLDM